jgi:hypothetical protein
MPHPGCGFGSASGALGLWLLLPCAGLGGPACCDCLCSCSCNCSLYRKCGLLHCRRRPRPVAAATARLPACPSPHLSTDNTDKPALAPCARLVIRPRPRLHQRAYAPAALPAFAATDGCLAAAAGSTRLALGSSAVGRLRWSSLTGGGRRSFFLSFGRAAGLLGLGEARQLPQRRVLNGHDL